MDDFSCYIYAMWHGITRIIEMVPRIIPSPNQYGHVRGISRLLVGMFNQAIEGIHVPLEGLAATKNYKECPIYLKCEKHLNAYKWLDD